MKRILLVGAMFGAIAMSRPAIAADAPWSWTGFYAGGNVGYGWGYIPSTYTETSTVTTKLLFLPPTEDVGVAGITATSTTPATAIAATLGQMNG